MEVNIRFHEINISSHFEGHNMKHTVRVTHLPTNKGKTITLRGTSILETDEIWTFSIRNYEKDSISIVLAEIGDHICELARLNIFLNWFEKNKVTDSSFPMRPEIEIATPTCSVSIHISEIIDGKTKDKFDDPIGQLLVQSSWNSNVINKRKYMRPVSPKKINVTTNPVKKSINPFINTASNTSSTNNNKLIPPQTNISTKRTMSPPTTLATPLLSNSRQQGGNINNNNNNNINNNDNNDNNDNNNNKIKRDPIPNLPFNTVVPLAFGVMSRAINNRSSFKSFNKKKLMLSPKQKSFSDNDEENNEENNEEMRPTKMGYHRKHEAMALGSYNTGITSCPISKVSSYNENDFTEKTSTQNAPVFIKTFAHLNQANINKQHNVNNIEMSDDNNNEKENNLNNDNSNNNNSNNNLDSNNLNINLSDNLNNKVNALLKNRMNVETNDDINNCRNINNNNGNISNNSSTNDNNDEFNDSFVPENKNDIREKSKINNNLKNHQRHHQHHHHHHGDVEIDPNFTNNSKLLTRSSSSGEEDIELQLEDGEDGIADIEQAFPNHNERVLLQERVRVLVMAPLNQSSNLSSSAAYSCSPSSPVSPSPYSSYSAVSNSNSKANSNNNNNNTTAGINSSPLFSRKRDKMVVSSFEFPILERKDSKNQVVHDPGLLAQILDTPNVTGGNQVIPKFLNKKSFVVPSMMAMQKKGILGTQRKRVRNDSQ